MTRHLYVHIPFCAKICPYCSFYKSEASRGGFAEFVEAVLVEARLRAEHIRPTTVFFGGGTPTALNKRQLERLISGLREVMDFSGVSEFTVEMNPATISPGKAEKLLALGVNRASIGVQSWDEDILRTLGRAHTPRMAEETVHTLRSAGFENINIDLMFGVPGQSPGSWHRSLRETLRLSPRHISAYSLTFEEDTEFFLRLARGEFQHDPHVDADLFGSTIETLEAAGFVHYETSNYCLPGRACAHNAAIWEGADYVGLGPSAVSTVRGIRRMNLPDTDSYCAALSGALLPPASEEYLHADDLLLERIALGLRTREGISREFINPRTFSALEKEGLIENHGSRLRLSRKGRPLADEIAVEIIGTRNP